jgi:small subunit ribosomal protein S1
MSWTKRVQHPSEVVRKGDDIEVMVLGVDPENKRISLGLKQLSEDPWDDLVTQYATGVEKDAAIVRILEDGVVVDLGDDVEGFVPRSHVPIDEGKDVADVIDPGQIMGVRVMETDGANRRIVLTVTEMPDPSTRRPKEEILAEQASADADESDEDEDRPARRPVKAEAAPVAAAEPETVEAVAAPAQPEAEQVEATPDAVADADGSEEPKDA